MPSLVGSEMCIRDRIIPWMGFSLSKLLEKVSPNSKAKFVEFTSVYDPEQMPGQRYPILQWPYKEAVSYTHLTLPTILRV